MGGLYLTNMDGDDKILMITNSDMFMMMTRHHGWGKSYDCVFRFSGPKFDHS